jgi:hypothetical protein
MRTCGKILSVALLVSLLAIPAFGWDLSIKGDAEWRYRYWTRTGDVDIFGPMDGSVVYLGINHLRTFPTTGTQNGPSSTFGVLAGENCYGKEISFVDYRMTLYPKIKVNPAIELDASMNLTSLGIWSDGQPYATAAVSTAQGYVNSLYVPISNRPVATDVPNTFVTLQWLKLGIKTPMLDISTGYKSSHWGMGLWKHKFNRASSSFSVSANYGPFKIGFSPYFARNESSWRVFGTSRNEGADSYQRQEQRRNYFLALQGELVYRSGDLEIGLLSDSYVEHHSNRVNARLTALTPNARPATPDVVRYRIDPFISYFNGRFFFNAEGAWFTRWRSGRATADPSNAVPTATNQRVRPNQSDEGFLYGLETGVICGPSKVTLNYIRSTGEDPVTRIPTEDSATSEQGVSAGYMKDWGLLMYYMYGTGSGWDAAGYGQPTNFQHLGGRLDYAVASNLNVFALYSYAWRDQPTAYTLGGDGLGAARLFTNDDIAAAQGILTITDDAFSGLRRAVPDSAREIGWEIDAGFDWKLLENLVWKCTFAYWKPGNWWSYAYPNTAEIYRGVGAGTPARNYNTTPGGSLVGLGRDVDPFFAVESNLLVSF